MHYVYVLRSAHDDGLYIGYRQICAGRFMHTVREQRVQLRTVVLGKLIYYEAYLDPTDALGRERYLKSGAGRRFLKTQLTHYLQDHPFQRAA